MTVAPDVIKRLIQHFEQQADKITTPSYNETQVRIDFINPMMRELGWDIDNTKGYAERYREVVHEDRIKVAGQTKAPDYSFRIGGQRKFFLEAKKPFIDIESGWESAYQLRRYAWSAKLDVSILTNFKEFAVYDTRIRPQRLERASTARREIIRYAEYEQRWDYLYETFSKEAVLRGDFDRYCDSQRGRGASPVDEVFLDEIEEWRKVLALSLVHRNKSLDNAAINFAVQRIIDRILFLRIAEDRGTEESGQLQNLLKENDIYSRLVTLFERADERYNSGLFHFAKERGRDETPDMLTPGLTVDDKTLRAIINGLYYPQSPYEFTMLSADILGSVYERFIGKVIIVNRQAAQIVEKPEVRKAGGVYYTPAYIVDYIIQETIGKKLAGKTPKDACKMKILDAACGSGSFLVGAYQYLLDWYLQQYSSGDPDSLSKKKNAPIRPAAIGRTNVDPDETFVPGWALTIAERKRILLDNIYGVDLDSQAVEVTKLNLLLKCLEGETTVTLGFGQQGRLFEERALPDLGNNILCGNSLVETDIITTDTWKQMREEGLVLLNPFDYNRGFKHGDKGFDVVIGNPPYIDSEWMSVHWPETRAYCASKYRAASGNWDIFCAFIDRTVALLKDGGMTSMIVPNKLATADYATGARRALTESARLVSIRDFSSVKVFPVSVYPIVYVSNKDRRTHETVRLQRVTTTTGARDGNNFQEVALPYSNFEDCNRGWDLSASIGHRALVDKINNNTVQLGSISTVLGAATVTEAYNMLNSISESEEEVGEIPIINSGTIDRYTTLWGRKAMRYLKKKFLRPVISPSNQVNLPRRRLAQSQSPKIIIAGMTLRLECCLDRTGNILAAKSTTIITGFPNLRQIIAVLNSRAMKFIYEQEFGGDKLQGGYLRVGPPQIKRLPIPVVNEEQGGVLNALVEDMLDLQERIAFEHVPQRQDQIYRQIDAVDRQIDDLVYQLYGLNDSDVAIIEEATRQ